VKDIFHVSGFETRAGSQLPPAELAGDESAAVTQLKMNGALILGKTVTTEFAYFAPGPTRNPHNIEHTPGGSSSGSAAAVAAGLAPLALGTQTIGSINRPAAYCGVVGYKPSYDRISRAGVIPLSPSLDHVGLFAKDVAGIRLAAPLLAQAWRPPETLKSPVLGVPTGPYLEHASPEAQTIFAGIRERLQAAGLTVKETPTLLDFAKIQQRHLTLMAAEAAEVHAAWFARYSERYHPKTAALIRKGQQIAPAAVAAARRARLQLRDELQTTMVAQGIDLWISPPATGAAPRGLESTGDPVMNLPWTQAGLPTLTLPAGVNARGLPLGLQLSGKWYQDEQLLIWAEEILARLLVER